MAVRIETADCAVAFLQNATTFFEERLDLLYEFFLVKFFFRGAVGFFDVLEVEGVRLAYVFYQSASGKVENIPL